MTDAGTSKVEIIEAWLAQEIERLEPGDRLPTVRDLMRRFSTAQRTVERALRPFLASGQLESRRRVGIVVVDPEASVPEAEREADLLVLYRLSDSRLARHLLQEVVLRLKRRGTSILHVGYTNEEQAISVMSRMGRFRACLIQLHFEVLSIKFLAALHEHADRIVIDGISATGIEADGIGTNWREALAVACGHLREAGHERIAFMTSAHSARQIAMARREYLLQMRGVKAAKPSWLIELDSLPGAYLGEDIKAGLAALRRPDGRFPFTALIVWGIVDGHLLERALRELDVQIGRDLSVVLLGSVDFHSEHLDQFDVVGNSDTDKLDEFEAVIWDRINGTDPAPDTHYLPIKLTRHGSVEKLTT